MFIRFIFNFWGEFFPIKKLKILSSLSRKKLSTITEERGMLLGKILLPYPASRSVNSDLYDNRVKIRHDLNSHTGDE